MKYSKSLPFPFSTPTLRRWGSCLCFKFILQKHTVRMRIRSTGTFTSFFKDNSRNHGFSYYFCWMIERSGAGSVLVTNGSGSGSGRPKNIRILRDRIRIRNIGTPTSSNAFSSAAPLILLFREDVVIEPRNVCELRLWHWLLDAFRRFNHSARSQSKTLSGTLKTVFFPFYYSL